ncbi:MAG: hypothetical protein ACREBS_03200 [Nitrososphaerales archaeon]
MYQTRNRHSTRWLLVPILVAVSVIAIVVGTGLYFATTGVQPPGYYWFPFPFFPLIFIPLIFLFFFGFRWFFWGCWGRGSYYGQYYGPAIVALRERYAKGEITKDQLEQMSKDLE